MKKIFFLSLAFLLNFNLNAFAKIKTASLPEVETAHANFTAFQADFEQITFIDLIGENLTKTGRLVAAKPKKFFIDYKSEPQKTYLYNGKYLWIHQHETKSVIRYKKPERWLSEEALSFLSGMEKLSTLFTDLPLEEIPDFKFQNKKLKALALVPLNPNDSILYLVLGVDENFLMKEAVIWTPSGNQSHYIFKNIQRNQKLDNNLFSWTKQPGVKLFKK